MKIKTNELIGTQLDWAVATCEGLPIRYDPMNFGRAFPEGGFWIWDDRGPIGKRDYRLIGRQYCPSTNWAQGGPIIERERILLEPQIGKEGCGNSWAALSLSGRCEFGPTPLIAAMRCFVAGKLGDIPEELK